MKTPSEDHDLIRWLDGEMNAEERVSFTARLDADPALKAEAEFMQRMSADLRSALPVEMPIPFGDFFNSQIQAQISQAPRDLAEPEPQRASWLNWFRFPGISTLAAVTAAVVIAGVMIMRQSPSGDSVVLSSYAPNQGVQVNAYYSSDAQATVLMLNGLEELPADRKVVGYHIERSEIDQEIAATTLYGDRGEIVVVAKDARNQPRLIAAANPRG
jgi:anti-sigma factor RsiW